MLPLAHVGLTGTEYKYILNTDFQCKDVKFILHKNPLGPNLKL